MTEHPEQIIISNKEIRAAIRQAKGLPDDAALELVDMLEQWQKTARAGKDACQRLGAEVEDLRGKLRVAEEALDKIEDWRPPMSVWCQGCYVDVESMARQALAEIRARPSEWANSDAVAAKEGSGVVSGPIRGVPRGSEDGCELQESDEAKFREQLGEL